MKIQVALVLTLCALLPRLTFSQSERRETVSQQTQWFSLTNNFKVSKRVTVLAEGQFRFANELQPMQFQFRTAGEIQVRKNLSIVPVGYVYTWNPIYGKQPAQFVNNEHRIFQQVLFKHQSGRFNISHRGRLEQRFIEVHTMHNGEVTYQGYDYYANRVRYRLMINVPLNTREIGTRTLFASFYDEVFLSWGPSVTYNKPDQNRVFMGIGYQLHKDFLITSGLVYQMLVKANGTMQENNFGFQISATHNIDLTNSL